ncbi:MAG: ATPase, partial [Chlamydiae bacterium]|nr:ATPase [Chlamydiota bacterium]
FFQRKANDRQGCQIDYMIQTKFGTCYLCEIKFNSQEITKSVIDEVKQKIKSLALPKNMSIRPVLIHVNGVDESVLESDFFSSIIDFNDLLHKH